MTGPELAYETYDETYAETYDEAYDETYDEMYEDAFETAGPPAVLGTLQLRAPGRSFSYRFTAEDLVWTAKLLVWEAGGRDDPDNAAVLWAMFNRYALFAHRRHRAFAGFVRAYSTTLQPVLNSAQAAARHAHRPDFVPAGGTYEGTTIPRGQLQRHIDIQRAPWSSVKPAAQALATRALSGRLANPGIGLASEFASTRVYFRQRNGRNPTVEEWRRYTTDLATRKRWRWIGDVSGLDQQQNAFFVDLRAAALPAGAVRVDPPGAAAGETGNEEEFERGEWELDDRADEDGGEDEHGEAEEEASDRELEAAALRLAVQEPQLEQLTPLEALRGLVSFGFGEPLQAGATGGAVELLQSSLQRLGHPVTDPAGTFGAATTAAVRAFQDRQGLCRTGVAGGQTKAAITRALVRLTDPGADPLPEAIVRVALSQVPRWFGAGGYLLETAKEATPILQEYYRDGVCRHETATDLRSPKWHADNAWSAAFISWVMRTAGAGRAFRYSRAHNRYMQAARSNRCEGNVANPFWAYRVTEVAPEPGDLVCRARGNHLATYDTLAQPMGWLLHCDIVTSPPRAGQIVVVGGNVAVPGGASGAGLTVAQRTLHVDADGRVDLTAKDQSRYIAVVRCRGAAPGVVAPC